MKSTSFITAATFAAGAFASVTPSSYPTFMPTPFPISYGTGASQPGTSSTATAPYPIIYPHGSNHTTSSTTTTTTQTIPPPPPPPTTTIVVPPPPPYSPSVITYTVTESTTLTVSNDQCLPTTTPVTSPTTTVITITETTRSYTTTCPSVTGECTSYTVVPCPPITTTITIGSITTTTATTKTTTWTTATIIPSGGMGGHGNHTTPTWKVPSVPYPSTLKTSVSTPLVATYGDRAIRDSVAFNRGPVPYEGAASFTRANAVGVAAVLFASVFMLAT